MVAYDSRRAVDPAHILGQEVVDALRTALAEQRSAGWEPTTALQHAVAAAAREARTRELAPELLLIQLKTLADGVGLKPVEQTVGPANPTINVREWMVGAMLRAYWQSADETRGSD